MNFFSLFFFFGFFVYLLMGFYALRNSRTGRLNLFFLANCVLFAVLSLENYLSFFFRDVSGRITRYVGVGEGVTRRKKLEEEAGRVNKLDSLVLMAVGIGHDLNNILAAMTGNLSLAKIHAKPDDRLFEYISEVEKAAFRARDLSWQFLTFSRDRKADRKSADIGALLKETMPFALRGLPLVFKIYTPENLWSANVDEGQFCQVIDNIVINSAQAMPDGGMLQVKCDNVILSSDKHYLPLKGGRYVKISVRDTGSGIAPENLSRIFDPYFTTKETGRGLGLTICYSIIKNTKGISTCNRGRTSGPFLPSICPRANRGQADLTIMERSMI